MTLYFKTNSRPPRYLNVDTEKKVWNEKDYFDTMYLQYIDIYTEGLTTLKLQLEFNKYSETKEDI